MKKFLILALLLCFMAVGAGAYATNSGYALIIENDIMFPSEYTCTYAIYATHRDALIDAFHNKNYFPEDIFPLYLEVNGYSETYETKKDIPYGNVYLMNGEWLVYYEQNQGYMPRWVTEEGK